MNRNNYILSFVYLLFLCLVNQTYSQTYNPSSQNTSQYTTDQTTNHFFYKAVGNSSIDINVSLNKLQFTDNNNVTYGWNGTNAIPSNWDFEILSDLSNCPTCVVSADKKKITYSGPENETIAVKLRIFDKDVSGNPTIANSNSMGSADISYRIISRFTTISKKFNSCTGKYEIKLKETSFNGNKPCSPYTIKIYSGFANQNNLVYESVNQTSPIVSLDLNIGDYNYVITDSCEQTLTGGFSVDEAYTFSADVTFAGYKCHDDSDATVDINIEGAEWPVTWDIKEKPGTGTASYSLNSSNTNGYSTSGLSDNVSEDDIVNYSVIVTGIPNGTYIFTFKDGEECEKQEEFTVVRPPELTATLDASVQQLACPGDTNGSLTFTGKGGWTEPFSGNNVRSVWGPEYTFTLTRQGTSSTYNHGSISYSFDGSGNRIGYKTTFSNLPAGTYCLTLSETSATNENDSEITYTCSNEVGCWTITDPEDFQTSITPSNYNGFGVKCKGDSNGTIDLNVTGGTAPYTYVWKKNGTTINNVTTQDLSGLGVGTYSVTITDAKNCTTTLSAEITEPVELTIADAGLSTAIACFGDNGQIRVNITGDSNGPSSSNTNGGTSRVYTYDLYQGSSIVQTTSITNLNHTFNAPAGTYKVRVTDVNGCFKETANIILTQPAAALSLSLSDTDITCFGLTNGLINSTVSGGTANYTYAWKKDGTSINATTANINNLGPGLYEVTVTDNNGCTITNTATITQPAQLAVVSTTPSNYNGFGVKCKGDENGTIDLNITGGTAPYTYVWKKNGTTINNVTTQDLSGLGVGTYSVTITDAKNCTTTLSAEITEPVELTIADAGLSTAIACFGDNGQIRVNITGDSNGPSSSNTNGGTSRVYTYDLYQGSSIVQTTSITNLNHTFNAPAGTYKVRVTDVNGCFKETANIILTQPAAALSLSLSDTDITCFGLTNGLINSTVSGGTANYTYAWKKDGTSINATTANINNLGPGLYEVTVTDNNGCIISDSIAITQPNDLTISETITDFEGYEISCNGADDAEIDITVAGGTVNYTYQWSSPDGGQGLNVNQADQTGLSPGTYKVVVTDNNGCTEEKTYVIEEPQPLASSSLIPNTNGFAISCNGANDGVINLTPSGGTGVYTYNWSSNVSNSGLEQGQKNQSGLKPGVYSVVISDSNQCSTTLNFTLTEPDAINATATLSNYNGFQISSKGAQDGSINLNVTGGYLTSGQNYTYNWSSNVSNSGFVQGQEDQTGLKAGTYTVTITDSNQCTLIRQYILNEPASLALNLDPSIFGAFNIKCFGDDNGSIDLTITGGSGNNTIVWTTVGGSGLVQGQEDQSGLGPGSYTVSVTDSNGANATETIQLTEPTILTVDNSIPLYNGYAISCNNGSNGAIDVSTGGGTGAYTFSWSTNNGGGNLVANSEDQTGLKAGTYFLTVTDSNGCSQSKTYVLQEPTAINVSASISNYNGFEISGAGKSDGEINITVTGGITDYSYQWSTNNGGGNLVANSEDQTGLQAGTYTVVVTDQNGCTETKVYTLSEPQAIIFTSSLSLFAGNFNISCKNAKDGSINITPSGGSGSYVYTWSTLNGSGLVLGQEDQSGLGPGTYSLTLSDSNGNQTTGQFVLTEPDEVIITQSSMSDYNNFEVSCFGGADGQINITPTGGTGVYTYTWTTSNGSGLQSGQKNQSGLSVGTYTVVVKDENNCSVSQTFTLDSPTALNIIATKKNFNGFNVSCNGSSDGEIDITVTGGYLDPNTVYTYTWSTSNGSGLNPNAEDQTGLTSGTYTVVATDANGCTITQDVEITQPNALGITETISDYNGFQISEAGENDGSIDITVSGGTSNYSYQWSTLDGSGYSANSEDQTSLTAGTYTVIVTDTNGCQITKEYILNEPKELIIAIDHDANGNSILCYGDSTASIKIDVTQESVSPYDYTITGTTYLTLPFNQTATDINAPTYSFVNLPAGQYTLTVVDANGSSRSTPIKEIFGPSDPLTMTSNVSAFGNFNISCPGADDATINLTVSGGGGVSNQATYFYTWSTSDGSGLDPSAEDQSGLGPGTYTVIVKDINDCSVTETFIVTEAPALTYNLDSIKNITCNGDNDGEINITVGGGTGNYTYEWSTENGSGIVQGQEDQSGLGPGNYKLVLRDGCNTFEYIYTISTPGILEITLDDKVNILCHDDSTGSINITVNGGTAPYDYVWTDGINTYDRNVGNVFNDGDLSNIPSGTYVLTVTDANGCVATFSTDLTQPEDLIIDIQKTDLNCYNSNDGTITVTPTGGVAPYSYTWSDNGNGNVRTGLRADTYSVTITDSNGCEEIRTVVIENAELFDVNPVVTPVSCFGANDGSIEMNFVGGVSPITFEWNDPAGSNAGQNRYNLSPGTYSVLITDASGCEIQRDFTIIEPQELTIAGLITDAIDCDNPASGSIDLQISGGNPPYTFQWSNNETTEDISGLLANNYSVIVTDSKGCTAEKEFVINRQEDLEISLETSLYAICETREVYQKNIVSVSGGVAPYVIEWSNGIVSGNNNEIMDTKTEGSYQVTVTDALGCSESIVFDVTTPNIGFPDFSYDSFYLSTYGSLAVNDLITFTNLSTEEYFNVFWDFGDGNSSEEINPTHTYTKRGVYEVTLTVEFILGCSYSISKTIYIGDSYEIVIPNAFTPNNDGYNDTFRAVYYGFKYIKMQIFDTWGNLIYSEESNTNELIGWSGRVGNKDGENGNYFYQISGNTHTDEKFSKNGAFTLIK